VSLESKDMEDVGLESWEFFVSRYRMKFRDNIVISIRNFTVCSLAPPDPVCRLRRPGNVSPFLLLHGVCSRLVMACHGRSAQPQVIRPNALYTCATDHFQNHNIATQRYRYAKALLRYRRIRKSATIS